MAARAREVAAEAATAAEVSSRDSWDMALQVEDIVEGEAEGTTAEVAGAAVAAEDTTAATRVEEDGAVPTASDSTKTQQLFCLHNHVIVLHQ